MFGAAFHLAGCDDFFPLRQGPVDRAVRLAFNETSITRLRRHMPLVESKTTARECLDRQAFQLKTFKDIVINGRMLRLGGDLLGRLRVPDDDIGISTRQDRTLSRIDVEDLRNIG